MLFREIGLFGNVFGEIEKGGTLLRVRCAFLSSIFATGICDTIGRCVFDVFPMAGLDGERSLYAAVVRDKVRPQWLIDGFPEQGWEDIEAVGALSCGD